MEKFTRIVKMLIASVAAFGGGAMLLFWIFPWYDASGNLLELFQIYRYEVIALIGSLIIANVARQFDHRIADMLTRLGFAFPTVVIVGYFLVETMHIPMQGFLILLAIAACATLLRLVWGDRIRVLIGLLLSVCVSMLIVLLIPSYSHDVDLEVIVRQQPIILVLSGESANEIRVERKKENQTKHRERREGEGVYSLQELPQELRIVGANIKNALTLILPDASAVTLSSPSIFQLSGAGWQKQDEAMVYDVKIAARQGTAEVCEECYRQVYTETMRAIVQDLYGDNRSDVELLHMLQRYKAEILRYRDEVSYTHQLQQMRRYHYFMGKMGHIPDGDRLWQYIPIMHKEDLDDENQELDYTPIREATTQNSKTGLGKTRYLKNLLK